MVNNTVSILGFPTTKRYWYLRIKKKI